MPINFPAKPNVTKPMSDLQFSTRELKHWDMAPDNLLYLTNSEFDFQLLVMASKKK